MQKTLFCEEWQQAKREHIVSKTKAARRLCGAECQKIKILQYTHQAKIHIQVRAIVSLPDKKQRKAP